LHELEGGCHCGNITVTYKTTIAPEDAKPRACQCSFCRKHQSRAISDPAGSVEFRIVDPAGVNRYRFGIGSCDFLVCRNCGVYVGAFMPDPDDDKGYATLMANCLADQGRYPQAAPTVYDGEDGEGKRDRRRRVWTPAVLRS
jgi:hypothetical protein